MDCPPEVRALLPEEKWAGLRQALEQDPRPSYQADGDRVYGLSFDRWEVRFSVRDGVLTVRSITPRADGQEKPRP